MLAAARSAGFATIIHSVLGDGGVATREEGRRRLARAFALNPAGVVLVSMLSAGHRAAAASARPLSISVECDGRDATPAKVYHPIPTGSPGKRGRRLGLAAWPGPNARAMHLGRVEL